MTIGELKNLIENLPDNAEVEFFYNTKSWGSVPMWIDTESKECVINKVESSNTIFIKLESPEDFQLD